MITDIKQYREILEAKIRYLRNSVQFLRESNLEISVKHVCMELFNNDLDKKLKELREINKELEIKIPSNILNKIRKDLKTYDEKLQENSEEADSVVFVEWCREIVGD